MREIEREGAHNERNTERNTTRQGGKREEKKRKKRTVESEPTLIERCSIRKINQENQTK